MGAFSPVVVVASAARTATGQSAALAPGGAVPVSNPRRISLLVATTAIGGTPNLVVSVEWSHDGGTTWAQADGTADAFAAITASGVAKVKKFDVKAPLYRVVWTITGGTPSITFSVSEFADTN